MAKKLTQKSFDVEFLSYIETHRDVLTATLTRLVSTPVPAEVGVLVFEVQSDWRDFPVYAFAFSAGSPEEVYFDPPFSGGLLPDIGRLVPYKAIDQDAYEAAGIGTFERGAIVLAEWFGKCWLKAGGKTFPIPAYVNHHDRDQYFDLKARRWVSDSTIWR